MEVAGLAPVCQKAANQHRDPHRRLLRRLLARCRASPGALTCKDVAALAAGHSRTREVGLRRGAEGMRAAPRACQRPGTRHPAGMTTASPVVDDVTRITQTLLAPARAKMFVRRAWPAAKSRTSSRGGAGGATAQAHLPPLAACTTTTPRLAFALLLLRRWDRMRPGEDSAAREAIVRGREASNR